MIPINLNDPDLKLALIHEQFRIIPALANLSEISQSMEKVSKKILSFVMYVVARDIFEHLRVHVLIVSFSCASRDARI